MWEEKKDESEDTFANIFLPSCCGGCSNYPILLPMSCLQISGEAA